MSNNSKRKGHRLAPDKVEYIILKLDKIEARLEIMKSVVFGFGKHTYQLKEKIRQIEGNIIKSKKEVDFFNGR